ncbi:MAG: GGDEF domain-containing protein [Clostridia bacterium]|nr:GGDEF domain-containing protein [Clostridia bacterium]
MDLQQFANQIDAMTCILSVEKKEDGSCGEIRLVTGNRAYIESIENPSPDVPHMMSTRFEPGSLYERYFPKDLNFELYCYSCAVERKPMHSYVNPGRFDFWFDIYMLPLGHEGNIYYCSYTQEITRQADSKKMTGISRETAMDVLNTCIKLRGVKDEAAFESTLRSVIVDIRDLCKARNCAVLLMDESRKECRVMSEAIQTTQDLTEKRQSMMPDFYKVALSWLDTIGGSNCLIVKDTGDMEYIRERNPVWYQSLMAARVQSIVIFPLKGGNDQLLGYIWATNFDTVETLHIKETLELSTYFIASEIANHMLLTRLRELSRTDVLTGIMNRNEMNNRIDELREGKARIDRLGIVFADLNGLKRVNDQFGHVEGDRMLKESAAVLRQVFAGDEIYRAGGDEFMIITRGAEEEELRKRCEEIKRHATGYEHVSFAAGYCVISDSREIRTALKTADERMYRDKETYYQDHPEMRR